MLVFVCFETHCVGTVTAKVYSSFFALFMSYVGVMSAGILSIFLWFWQVVFTEFTQLYPDFRNVMEAEKSSKQCEFGKLESVKTGFFYRESVKWQLPFNLSWKHQINSLNAKVAIV